LPYWFAVLVSLIVRSHVRIGTWFQSSNHPSAYDEETCTVAFRKHQRIPPQVLNDKAEAEYAKPEEALRSVAAKQETP
jgi:hypothetical protein